MIKKTQISIIVCTYNNPMLIKRCLNSILKQKLNEKIEILIIDGGSDRKTLEVIREFGKKDKRIKVFNNPEKLPEGYGKGKWLGFIKAKGEIVGVIDQDNMLIGEDCLKKLIEPFENRKIFGVACRLFLDNKDSLTNQCIALIGTDPFVAYRSLDEMINFNNLNLKNEKNYKILDMDSDNLIIVGGNCFFYRKKFLNKVGGYIQDTDNVFSLVNEGYTQLAIPDSAFTHHYAVNGLKDFIQKKKKWAREYTLKNRKFSWMPTTKLERREFIKNIFSILAVFPIFFEGYINTIKTGKKQWLFTPILKIITTFVYIIERRYL